MRIFSFSGLRIVRLRPRRPLPAGANRLVHGRLRRFHPSAQPRACGCPRSASFSGPDAHRMRPGRSPENISGNMSEDMSGNLSGVLPERASRRSPGWLRKEARTASRETLQTALREVLQTAFRETLQTTSREVLQRRPSGASEPGTRGPGPAAALARDGRSPFYSVAENIFLLFE